MNWIHSCKQVGELISRRLDEPLNLLDSMRLRIHPWICGNCRQVERQIEDLHVLSIDLLSEDLFWENVEPDSSADRA